MKRASQITLDQFTPCYLDWQGTQSDEPWSFGQFC
jgi:hypothetical protein